MLREFARVEAFNTVSPVDLLPLRSLDPDAQSRVLGILWERFGEQNQCAELESDWFVRELLAEVSRGSTTSRFNPDTIKLLNRYEKNVGFLKMIMCMTLLTIDDFPILISVLVLSKVLSKPNVQNALIPLVGDEALTKLDSDLLGRLAQMDNHTQIVCLQRALVTTDGTPLDKLIQMLSSKKKIGGAGGSGGNGLGAKEKKKSAQYRAHRKTTQGENKTSYTTANAATNAATNAAAAAYSPSASSSPSSSVFAANYNGRTNNSNSKRSNASRNNRHVKFSASTKNNSSSNRNNSKNYRRQKHRQQPQQSQQAQQAQQPQQPHYQPRHQPRHQPSPSPQQNKKTKPISKNSPRSPRSRSTRSSYPPRNVAQGRTYGSHHSTVLNGYSYNPREESKRKKEQLQKKKIQEKKKEKKKHSNRKRGKGSPQGTQVAIVPGKQDWSGQRKWSPRNTRPLRDESRTMLVVNTTDKDNKYNDTVQFSSMDVPAPPQHLEGNFSGQIVFIDGYAQNITEEHNYSNQYQ